ncbi:hypothetical protein [Nocardia miyunensis]|uniref:hypothetical protein n=1 Tax=Nocardia miyunensis TaxID=282684 RepID=UPI0012F4D6C1|nr:hypothetical protein [Nocardia miyunensis]
MVDEGCVGDPFPGAVVDAAGQVVLHLVVCEVETGVFAHFRRDDDGVAGSGVVQHLPFLLLGGSVVGA